MNPKVLLKVSLLVLIWAVVLTVAIGGTFAWWFNRQVTTFTTAANTTAGEVLATGVAGWTKTLTTADGHLNLLVLGLDTIELRDSPPLTDTMLLVSLNTKTGTISTLPLPRDLWSDAQQTRLNALYIYGRERYPTQPQRFSTEVISQLINQPIHHTVVISLEQVAQLIDLVGGLTIDVPAGFTDPEYPRSGVDVAVERDPAILYETVTFNAGVQTMNGETALKYIRSRHSSGDQGSDTARSTRQQQVLSALLQKLTQNESLTNLTLLGKLYRYYQENFNHYLPMTEAIAITKQLIPVRNQVQFESHQVSIYPDDPAGVIFHPPLSATRNQWLYQVRDQAAFQQEVQDKLYLGL